MTKSNISDIYFRSRESNTLKEKLLAFLFRVLNDENEVDSADPASQYKYYVGKGNNSFMLRTLFKTRYWWFLHDKEEIEKVNFMWTQLRKNTILNCIPAVFEEPESIMM